MRASWEGAISPYDQLFTTQAERDDDAATISMVDSNQQRENLLPSEKAFSYQMKLEEMKRQAGRPKANSVQVGLHF